MQRAPHLLNVYLYTILADHELWLSGRDTHASQNVAVFRLIKGHPLIFERIAHAPDKFVN